MILTGCGKIYQLNLPNVDNPRVHAIINLRLCYVMKEVMFCNIPGRGTAYTLTFRKIFQQEYHGLREEAFRHGGLCNLRRKS
jgi:hypothetical protein